MTILHLATNTMIISRMTAVSGYKQTFSTVTACQGALQPLSQADAQLFDGAFGRTFQFFADPTVDIQEGDRLRDSSGIDYRVRKGGVVRRTSPGGNIDFIKVICERIQ